LSGDTLVITDFDPAEDRLEIQLSREAESVNSLRIETDGDDALVMYDVFDASGEDPYSHQIRLVGAAGVALDDVGFVTSALQLGPDLLDGSDGDDVIALGGAGSGFEGGYIRGFAGDDLVTLAQDAPNSILALGDGEDSVTGFATAVVHLEAGDDFAELDGDGNTGGAPSTVTGGEGNDTISALNGRADIHGDAGDDVITGSNAAQIWGGDGDDRIEIVYQLDPEPGFPGIAAVYGGAGSDSVTGSTGADYIADGVLVDGEIGYDGVDAGTDNDLFDGGAGDDRLVYAGGDDTLLGGAGSDSLFAVHFDTPTGGSAHFDGGFGDDTLAGSLGAADSLVGGAGDDLLMSAYLLQGETPVGDPQDGRIAYDHAVGDDVSDRLEGGGGDDTILFDRNDSVTGGRGADEFRLTLHDLVSAPDSGDGVARISDFDRSEDVLMIFVEDLASSTLTVSNGASGSTVFVNGSAVLEVEGVSDLTEFDLILSEGGPLAEEVAVTL
ncbi:calcium-binding protein, partial [Shimia sp.]|uniref:calcium-binding protein n=1 Tax=Shimia sp. TaxID=1954381 RepID=UPI00356A7145